MSRRIVGWAIVMVLGLGAVTAGCRTTQSAGTQLDDSVISAKVNAKLTADRDVSVRDVTVQTNEGVVTLTGRVPDATARNEAERIARAVEGVRQVRNHLEVGDLRGAATR